MTIHKLHDNPLSLSSSSSQIIQVALQSFPQPLGTHVVHAIRLASSPPAATHGAGVAASAVAAGGVGDDYDDAHVVVVTKPPPPSSSSAAAAAGRIVQQQQQKQYAQYGIDGGMHGRSEPVDLLAALSDGTGLLYV